MNEYIEPLVDLETAESAGEIIARIENAWDAIDQANGARMQSLAQRRLVNAVRAWVLAAVVSALIWFAIVSAGTMWAL